MDYKKEQAEIWAIDADWLSYKKEGAEKIERVADIIGRVEYASFEKKAQELANAAYADKNRAFHNEIIHGLMRERRQCVYNVTPFRLNERVLAQKGTFLLQGDTSKCFVRNLESTITQGNARADGALKRIVVKFSKIREFWINLASSSADKPKHLWQESD